MWCERGENVVDRGQVSVRLLPELMFFNPSDACRAKRRPELERVPKISDVAERDSLGG
jgi:hypothetical protein